MAYSQAQREWIKTHTSQVRMSLHNVNDSDILNKLNSVKNKQGYIKELIRKDIGTYVEKTEKKTTSAISSSICAVRGKPLIDLTGKQFGKWTVLRRDESVRQGAVYWTCKCECGNIRDVTSQALRNGSSQGCQSCKWKSGNPGMKADPERQVDGKRTKAYATWQAIRARCYIKNHKSYHNYGGRGIKLCDEWYSDFHSFYQYVSALPNYKRKTYTLDRINNDGNYEPGNVRWASKKQQAQNRRKSDKLPR